MVKHVILEADDGREQAPLPPPSTPICRKLQNGIDDMFVEKKQYSYATTKIQLTVARLERLALWE